MVFNLPATAIQAAPSLQDTTTSEGEEEENVVELEKNIEHYYYGVGPPKTSLVEESAGTEVNFERYYYGVGQ